MTDSRNGTRKDKLSIQYHVLPDRRKVMGGTQKDIRKHQMIGGM